MGDRGRLPGLTRLRGFATLGLLLALLGCGARPDATPAIRSISANITLTDAGAFPGARGQECAGRGAYADLVDGSRVTIANSAATPLGTARLGAGTVEDANTCRFSFTARGIPEAAFYLVGIGKRTPLPFSWGELSQDGWTLNIALGSGG